MTTETYTVLEYSELDDLIREHLWPEWDTFVAYQEANNYSNYDFDLRYRESTARDGSPIEYGWKREIREYEERPEWGSKTVYALAKLIEKGILPEDNQILIKVFW